MQTGIALLIVYLAVTVALQAVALFASWLIHVYLPTWSLLAFLVFYLGAFWIAWRPAVAISYWLIPNTDAEREANKAAIAGVKQSDVNI